MATKYEIFLKVAGGYQHVATKDSGSARGALDLLVKEAEEFQAAAATMAGQVEDVQFEPTDTSGEYLVVPTTNATFIRRRVRSEFVNEEYDPIHDEPVQQEIS